MVVGDNHEKQLQPFHEFECTGTNDEFVQNVDLTDELRKKYEDDTETIRRLRAPDGSLHEPYNDEFYRELTPEENTIKPIGWWRNQLSVIGRVKIGQTGDWMTAHVECHQV